MITVTVYVIAVSGKSFLSQPHFFGASNSPLQPIAEEWAQCGLMNLSRSTKLETTIPKPRQITWKNFIYFLFLWPTLSNTLKQLPLVFPG